MAKMQVEGLEEYTLALESLSNNSEKILKKSVYKGAGIVADAIKSELRGLPIDNSFGSEENQIRGLSNKQKGDLINGMGISPIKHDGDYINAKVGFDGYGSIPTKKYPKGVPNQLVARSVNSGTSFRKKNPFVNRAVNKSKKEAQKLMPEVIDEEIKKELK